MKLFRKAAIIGTGLIGGSLALAIKKKELAELVAGVSRQSKNLAIAKKRGAIDQGSRQLAIIKGADLVILATPVNTILELAPKISRLISKDCIVTDVGSTKQKIVSRLERFFPNYVGTHPLAGLEKRGISYADSGIFKNTLCIITPTNKTRQAALRKVKALWQSLGAKMIMLSPAGHDQALSFVSHLAHIVSFSLINTVPQKYLKFSSSGLKDTTRIAASDSQLWTDIFLSNSGNVLNSIKDFQRNLSAIKSAIQKKERKKLAALLRQAKAKREKLG